MLLGTLYLYDLRLRFSLSALCALRESRAKLQKKLKKFFSLLHIRITYIYYVYVLLIRLNYIFLILILSRFLFK